VATVALVVLAARSVAYALSPSPLARTLGQRAGGPALPVVVAGAAVAAVALGAVIVWLAALGVRERALVEDVAPPPLRLRVLAPRTLLLFLTSSAGFAFLESYLHWRAGLGWHSIHCLLGPAHRNPVPILAALSLVAAAVATALEHVLAWMCRTIQRIRGSQRRFAAVAFACRSRFASAPIPRLERAKPDARAPPRALHAFS